MQAVLNHLNATAELNTRAVAAAAAAEAKAVAEAEAAATEQLATEETPQALSASAKSSLPTNDVAPSETRWAVGSEDLAVPLPASGPPQLPGTAKAESAVGASAGHAGPYARFMDEAAPPTGTEEWVPAWSPVYTQWYWYSPKTKECSWEQPSEAANVEIAGELQALREQVTSPG